MVTTWYVAPGGSDSNTCTSAAQPCANIQTAIDKAASGDTINIATGAYIESLTIADKNLTLTGQGAANTFLVGDGSSSILQILRSSAQSVTIYLSGVTLNGNSTTSAGGAIQIEASCFVTISDSVIAGNTTTISSGGGISNQGTLKLINVTVRDNRASIEGGGIYNTGNLELSNVLVTDNDAPSGGGISNQNTVTVTASSIISNTSSGPGGGIYNVTGSAKLTLVNSNFSENFSFAGSGGAIYNNGVLTSTNTIIVGNDAAFSGGGLYNDTTSRTTLAGNTIQNNTSTFEGGGLFNSGTAQIDETSITSNLANNNGGGGIHNAAGGKLTVESSAIVTNTAAGSTGGGINNAGALTLTQSALAYNAASQGGGLNNAGAAQLTNVTVSNNTASSGGGIQNSGITLTLQFSTVSFNSPPSLNNIGGSVTVSNSILAQSAGPACGGTITSANYNMDTGTTCGFGNTKDLSNSNPQLGPLQDNGGNSPTRAIPFSSVAVDSATSACPPPATDQRGVIRPQSGACDRGAYEVVGYADSDGLDIGPGPGACVTSAMPVNDKFFIGRMLVGVNLTYPDRADLTIRLLSPGGRTVTLLGPAASHGQDLNTMFDDSALTGMPALQDQDTSVPFSSYIFKPATPLLQLRGTSIRGIWTLQICNAGAGTGTLRHWVIVVPEFTNILRVYMPLIRR